MNECMSKEFTVCPQTTESFECVFIYMKRSVVCSQTTKLGFGIFLDFLSGKDIDVCAESDVIRGASLQVRKQGGWLGLFGMLPGRAAFGS